MSDLLDELNAAVRHVEQATARTQDEAETRYTAALAAVRERINASTSTLADVCRHLAACLNVDARGIPMELAKRAGERIETLTRERDEANSKLNIELRERDREVGREKATAEQIAKVLINAAEQRAERAERVLADLQDTRPSGGRNRDAITRQVVAADRLAGVCPGVDSCQAAAVGQQRDTMAWCQRAERAEASAAAMREALTKALDHPGRRECHTEESGERSGCWCATCTQARAALASDAGAALLAEVEALRRVAEAARALSDVWGTDDQGVLYAKAGAVAAAIEKIDDAALPKRTP